MTALSDILAVLRATITGGDPIEVLLQRWQGRTS